MLGNCKRLICSKCIVLYCIVLYCIVLYCIDRGVGTREKRG